MATYLDSSVLFVAFPDITNSFSNATTATLSWVLNAYTITFAALLVPAAEVPWERHLVSLSEGGGKPDQPPPRRHRARWHLRAAVARELVL